MAAPRIRIAEAEAFERWTPFVRPFRFGAVTVEGAFQAFLNHCSRWQSVKRLN